LAGGNKVSLSTFIVDITERAAIEGLLKNVIDQLGFVHGITNNACIIQPFIKVNELGYEAIERVMNVIFYGILYMTKTFFCRTCLPFWKHTL